jgi:hypothetical protein
MFRPVSERAIHLSGVRSHTVQSDRGIVRTVARSRLIPIALLSAIVVSMGGWFWVLTVELKWLLVKL